jgi:hypothetical protein
MPLRPWTSSGIVSSDPHLAELSIGISIVTLRYTNGGGRCVHLEPPVGVLGPRWDRSCGVNHAALVNSPRMDLGAGACRQSAMPRWSSSGGTSHPRTAIETRSAVNCWPWATKLFKLDSGAATEIAGSAATLKESSGSSAKPGQLPRVLSRERHITGKCTATSTPWGSARTTPCVVE